VVCGRWPGPWLPWIGPSIVPQHDPCPRVAATAKEMPVLGELAKQGEPCSKQPRAQAAQTPGDTTSAAMNRSVWVTRTCRLRSTLAPPAPNVRATTASIRSSLLPNVTTPVRLGCVIPPIRPCRPSQRLSQSRPPHLRNATAAAHPSGRLGEGSDASAGISGHRNKWTLCRNRLPRCRPAVGSAILANPAASRSPWPR
jgi:hypothetical protein